MRKSLPMACERVREVDVTESRLRRAGVSACAAPWCDEDAAGSLCDQHWSALPLAMRSELGAAERQPAFIPTMWLRRALGLLAEAVVAEYDRPKRAAECKETARPCPWVSCEHHLYLSVTPMGAIRFHHPDREPWELEETCALDVEERGGVTLEQAGSFAGMSVSGAKRIQRAFLTRLRAVLGDPGRRGQAVGADDDETGALGHGELGDVVADLGDAQHLEGGADGAEHLGDVAGLSVGLTASGGDVAEDAEGHLSSRTIAEDEHAVEDVDGLAGHGGHDEPAVAERVTVTLASPAAPRADLSESRDREGQIQEIGETDR